MGQFDLFNYVVQVLERMGLRYFVTGSTASTAYGEARFTNDIDIVVDLPPEHADEFCLAFPTSDFYVSRDAARSAVVQRSQFNIIHPESGLKVDLIVAPDLPFNRSRFHRKLRLRTGPGIEAWFASAEDVVLKKLEYYREGGSEKHLRDIAGILKVRSRDLDLAYVQEWAAKLDLLDIWQEVLRRQPPTS